MDKWILHRLNVTVKTVNKGFSEFELGNSANAVYAFLLNDMCDVYFEAIKPIMNNKDRTEEVSRAQAAVRATLYTIMDEGLILIHPFMPYISEELWQRFPRRPGDQTESLCVASYPTPQSSRDAPQIDAEVITVNKIVTIARSLQGVYNITKNQKPTLTVNANDQSLFNVLTTYKDVIITLSYIGNLEISLRAHTPPKGCATEVPDSTCVVYLHIKGLIDFTQERTKLVAKLKAAQDNKEQVLLRMSQADYVHVPQSVKEQMEEKLSSLNQEIASIEKAVLTLEQLLLEDKSQ